MVLKYYASRAAARRWRSGSATACAWNTCHAASTPSDRYGALVVGFAQIDQKGSYGIEAKYDQFLRENGEILPTAADGQVQPLPANFSSYVPSPVGRDLVLTIDRRIQAIAEDEPGRAGPLQGGQWDDHRHGPKNRRDSGQCLTAQFFAQYVL